MVDMAVESNIGSMLVHRLLAFSNALKVRRWNDEELPMDLTVVHQVLEENLLKLRHFLPIFRPPFY